MAQTVQKVLTSRRANSHRSHKPLKVLEEERLAKSTVAKWRKSSDFSKVGSAPVANQSIKPLSLVNCGAQGRNRTTDTVIFSHVLYQLSYLGSWKRAGGPFKRPAP